MTFSIVAHCKRTGQFGIAISSSSPAVAARCAYARAGVGVVASQNVTDPRLGPAALEVLARGAHAEECRDIVMRTAPGAAYRQLVVLDKAGRVAIWSGAQTLGVHAAAIGQNVASAGNLLATDVVPRAICDAFTGLDTGLALGERLLRALEAGLAAGGEAGPVRSAGMIVVDREAWPLVDLRVDWDEAPVARLRALWEVWHPQMHDYVTRALNPSGAPRYGVPGDQ